MEALLIINSVLVTVSLYFLKDFHADFKDVAKRVFRIESKIEQIENSSSKKKNARGSNLRKVDK